MDDMRDTEMSSMTSGDDSMVKFRVEKDDFAGAISWVARSLPSKPVQPVLKGILIEADDTSLAISGYDYDVSTQTKISAEVIVPGRLAVPGKLLADIATKLPSKPVEISYDGAIIVISCGQSRFEIPSIPVEDYPELPELPSDAGTVNPGLFAKAVTQVAIAASRDENIPWLTGIYVGVDGSEVTLATTDRFRMAVRTFEWNSLVPGMQAEILVPAKTLVDNAKSLDSATAEDIVVALDGEDSDNARLLGIRAGNRKTTSRLLENKFPKFRPVLPKSHNSIATVNVATLIETVNRVVLVADSTSQIRLDFTGEDLIVSAGGADSGHAEERIPCAFVGEPIVTGFNAAYLKEGLAAMRCERVFFGFVSSGQPVLAVPEPEELPEADDNGKFPTPTANFRYLLMPVRLPQRN